MCDKKIDPTIVAPIVMKTLEFGLNVSLTIRKRFFKNILHTDMKIPVNVSYIMINGIGLSSNDGIKTREATDINNDTESITIEIVLPQESL